MTLAKYIGPDTNYPGVDVILHTGDIVSTRGARREDLPVNVTGLGHAGGLMITLYMSDLDFNYKRRTWQC